MIRPFTTIIVTVFFVCACSRPKPSTTSNIETKAVQIPVEGMVCGACVANVKRGLKSQKGVEEVEVSLEQRQARVRYESTVTNPQQLAKIIRDLGYTPGVPSEAPR